MAAETLVDDFNRHARRAAFFIWSIMTLHEQDFDSWTKQRFVDFYFMPDRKGISPKVVACFLQQGFSNEEAIQKARQDLAQRLGVRESDIEIQDVDDAEFPDTALGASVGDEMSGQMITPGCRIRLLANGQTFEYRANQHQVRLYNYEGGNYRI